MKTKKFKRSDFNALISNYTAINLLNCMCAVLDKLCPETGISQADSDYLHNFLRGYIRSKNRHRKRKEL
jgi:hypothetical protein